MSNRGWGEGGEGFPCLNPLGMPKRREVRKGMERGSIHRDSRAEADQRKTAVWELGACMSYCYSTGVSLWILRQELQAALDNSAGLYKQWHDEELEEARQFDDEMPDIG